MDTTLRISQSHPKTASSTIYSLRSISQFNGTPRKTLRKSESYESFLQRYKYQLHSSAQRLPGERLERPLLSSQAGSEINKGISDLGRILIPSPRRRRYPQYQESSISSALMKLIWRQSQNCFCANRSPVCAKALKHLGEGARIQRKGSNG